jgi:hypothetical protein
MVAAAKDHPATSAVYHYPEMVALTSQAASRRGAA